MKRPLRRTEVGQVQCRVRVDHAHQSHPRKIESLGDHLRSQQDVHLSVAEGRERLVVSAVRLHRVGVHSQNAGSRKARGDLGLELLSPHAGVLNAAEFALGALTRRGRAIVAVMADGLLPLAMVRERQLAMRAAQHHATLRALDVRRVAAAIEQQDHLSAVAQSRVDRLVHLPTDRPAAAAIVEFVAEIDRANHRHRPIENPPRHLDQPKFSLLGAIPAFQRRRSRAKHQRNLLRFGPPERDLAGMIARRRFLLEGGLMLLVEHDQPQVRRRGKNGAPRADDDLHLAARDPLPMPVPLRLAQMAVQHGHLIEAGAEPLAGLRGEADFGHEHDRLPTEPHDLLNRLDVDLGLAAPRHAVNENRLVPLRIDRGEHRVERHALIVVKRVIGFARRHDFMRFVRRHGPRFDDDESLFQERTNRRGRRF